MNRDSNSEIWTPKSPNIPAFGVIRMIFLSFTLLQSVLWFREIRFSLNDIFIELAQYLTHITFKMGSKTTQNIVKEILQHFTFHFVPFSSNCYCAFTVYALIFIAYIVHSIYKIYTAWVHVSCTKYHVLPTNK